MLLVRENDIVSISITGGVLCAIQLMVMLCTIIPMELALKESFDQFGTRHETDCAKKALPDPSGSDF